MGCTRVDHQICLKRPEKFNFCRSVFAAMDKRRPHDRIKFGLIPILFFGLIPLD